MCCASKACWLHTLFLHRTFFFCFFLFLIWCHVYFVPADNHLTTGTQAFTFLTILALEQLVATAFYGVPASKALTTLTFAATLFSINNPFRLISLSSGESSLQRRSFHAYQTSLLLRTKLQWSGREEGRDLGAKKRRLTAFTAQLLFLKHSYAVNKFLLCVYFMPGTKLGTVLYS